MSETRPPAAPAASAAVILVRESPLEVFLVRRHRKSGFMPATFVFPGGKVEPVDGSAEVTAIRELFEEAGVLVADGVPADLAGWRRRLLACEASFVDLLATGVRPAVERLCLWSRWITPSVEPRRFDARFFLAVLPAGQDPSVDDQETVDAVWVTPGEALARQTAGKLPLPPPQIRTLCELAPFATAAALRAEAARRLPHIRPVMPRFAGKAAQLTILLPWDPEYESGGVGEGLPIPGDHALAGGASRFVLQGDSSWAFVSPAAG